MLDFTEDYRTYNSWEHLSLSIWNSASKLFHSVLSDALILFDLLRVYLGRYVSAEQPLLKILTSRSWKASAG